MNIYDGVSTKNSIGNSLPDFHEKELDEKILDSFEVYNIISSTCRTIFFYYALVLGFTIVAVALSGQAIRNFLIGSVIVAALFLGVSQLDLFQDAREVFDARWRMATEIEGGDDGVTGVLTHRVGGAFLRGLKTIPEVPFFGVGIGIGTNVGAKLATGDRAFLIAEDAWSSTVGEFGPVLGGLLIFLRIVLATIMTLTAVRQSFQKNTLPLILCSSVLPAIVIGGTAQPTALGFMVFSGGLLLAACNPTREWIIQCSAGFEVTESQSEHA